MYYNQDNKIYLIKSDGGIGPVKSGNLHLQGAKSDGKTGR